MDTDNVISQNLKKYRKENSLTQRQVADYLHVHPTTVQKWESGKNRIYPNELDSLSRLYKVRVNDIMSESKKPEECSYIKGDTCKVFKKYLKDEHRDGKAQIGDIDIFVEEKICEYNYDTEHAIDNKMSMSIRYEKLLWNDHLYPDTICNINIYFENIGTEWFGPDYKKYFEQHKNNIEDSYEILISKILDNTISDNEIKQYNIEYIEAYNIKVNDNPLFIHIDNNENRYFSDKDTSPVRCIMNMSDKTVNVINKTDCCERANIGHFLGKAITDYEYLYPDIAEIVVGKNCENIINFNFYGKDDYKNRLTHNGILESVLKGGLYQCTNAETINKTALFVLEYVKSPKVYECGIMLDVCKNRHLYKETIEKIYSELYESDIKYDNFYMPGLDKGCAWALALNHATPPEILKKIYKNIPKIYQLRNDQDIYNLQLRMALLQNGNCNFIGILLKEIEKTRINYEKYGIYENQWNNICLEPTNHCLMSTNDKTIVFPYGNYKWERSERIDDIFEEYDELDMYLSDRTRKRAVD